LGEGRVERTLVKKKMLVVQRGGKRPPLVRSLRKDERELKKSHLSLMPRQKAGWQQDGLGGGRKSAFASKKVLAFKEINSRRVLQKLGFLVLGLGENGEKWGQKRTSGQTGGKRKSFFP